MRPPKTEAETLSALASQLGDGKVLVLTGAGCSTGSGIPDYRDDQGRWKRSQPMLWQEFLRSDRARQRYWARSLLGWLPVAAADPGPAHRALARFESAGLLRWLITQNVDGLHQRAGHRRVTDLHGRLDVVRCLACDARTARQALQTRLLALNPDWEGLRGERRPDGDAELEGVDWTRFRVPDCPACGGVLKPDVVFFGETVPRATVDACFRRLAQARLLLVVGSSLMVWSGYRFVRKAVALGVPVAIVNRGQTRGDAEASVRLQGDCAHWLEALAERLAL